MKCTFFLIIILIGEYYKNEVANETEIDFYPADFTELDCS